MAKSRPAQHLRGSHDRYIASQVAGLFRRCAVPIDLSKPIRRKGDHKLCIVSKLTSYYVEPIDDIHTYKLSRCEFEAIYENIPELRKPREWRAYEDSLQSCEFVRVWKIGSHPYDRSEYRTAREAPLLRLIELPEGAELPEWPKS